MAFSIKRLESGLHLFSSSSFFRYDYFFGLHSKTVQFNRSTAPCSTPFPLTHPPSSYTVYHIQYTCMSVLNVCLCVWILKCIKIPLFIFLLWGISTAHYLTYLFFQNSLLQEQVDFVLSSLVIMTKTPFLLHLHLSHFLSQYSFILWVRKFNFFFMTLSRVHHPCISDHQNSYTSDKVSGFTLGVCFSRRGQSKWKNSLLPIYHKPLFLILKTYLPSLYCKQPIFI